MSWLELSVQDAMPELTLAQLGTWLSAVAMMFGGVVPYVPQYREIKKTKNADGFSPFVCLALLVANTLRILFWFGHPFETPLLVQSVVMTVCMLALMQLCVRTKNQSLILPVPGQTFTEGRANHGAASAPPRLTIWDWEWRHFWAWTDFLSYLEFLASFTCLMGILMYLFLDVPLVVETVGFLAVLTEALLGVPQFLRNVSNQSTSGMSLKMVVLWMCGDVFKTCYFVLRKAPLQFGLCGALQVMLDMAILGQVAWYGQGHHKATPVLRFLKAPVHTS
ncbi:solute carrier family 66 member 2-like isoform X2 [Ornithodoros turicata]|uniref:solute carrier family 66 member 2-like isoform X2 n=1 Tax=Ornithodoros turicata TaxID=34597 RepID=UPI003139EE25